MRELVKFTLKSVENEDINFIDLNGYDMPTFSEDKEKNGYPEQAQKFLDAITNSDAIICSLAEHNRSYAAAFKNIFDWASRINVNVFQNKPMLLMTTSPGGLGSQEKELFWIEDSNQRFYAYNYFGQHPEKLVGWFDKHMN